MARKRYVLWFKEIGIKDVPKVGGKGASLGEMYSKLTKKGVAVPNGFAVTAEAYEYFIDSTGVKKEIKKILRDLNTRDIHNLQARGQAVRQAILAADFPQDLAAQIVLAYKKLSS